MKILNINALKYLCFAILFLIVIGLYNAIDNLSISYDEALNYFINNSVLSVLVKASTYIFGQNDFALRLPFIIFYFLSIFLMFKITKDFFKKEEDRYLSLIIFMLLPGILAASLLVNSAIVVTFFTLLYIFYYKTYKKHSYILLFLFLFVDNSFAIFFLALFFYSLNVKDNKLLVISLVLFGISMGIYGFDSTGKPKGFLIDTFGIYASIFSPLLFIYFFYSLYRNGVKDNRDIIWYISATSLVFSLILSFRQKIYIEDYAPFVIIFVPHMVKTFFYSLRSRLPQFRYRHYYTLVPVLFILFLNVLITFFNKPLYLFLENPKKHFAYKYNLAKEIAIILKQHNINYIYSNDEKLILRLRFYKIKEGDKYFITTNKIKYYDKKYDIKYFEKKISTLYIYKL